MSEKASQEGLPFRIFSENLNTTNKNMVSVIDDDKKLGPKVNSHRRFCHVPRTKGRFIKHCIARQLNNGSFENVDTFKYFGTTLTNERSIHEEIKSRLRLNSEPCQPIYLKTQ